MLQNSNKKQLSKYQDLMTKTEFLKINLSSFQFDKKLKYMKKLFLKVSQSLAQTFGTSKNMIY